MTATGPSRLRVDAARVTQDTFVALRGDWIALILLTLGLQILPLAVIDAAVPMNPALPFGRTPFVAFSLTSLFMVTGGLFRAAASALTVGRLAGRPLTVSQPLAIALASLPGLVPYLAVVGCIDLARPFILAVAPVYVVTLPLAALGLAIALGCAAFLGLAVPVLAVEDRSFLIAARRSAQLLRGRRLAFVGAFLAYRILDFAPRLFFAPWLMSTSIGRAAAGPNGMSTLWTILAGLPSLIVGMVWCVASAAAYREFARVQAGVPPGEVAAVFD